jgi:hypothetical protein
MCVIRFLCSYCTLPFYRICVSLQRTTIVQKYRITIIVLHINVFYHSASTSHCILPVHVDSVATHGHTPSVYIYIYITKGHREGTCPLEHVTPYTL